MSEKIRHFLSEELEIDLRKLNFIERILALTTPSTSSSNSQNRIALKTFVDWFSESMGVVEAHKRKAEIEAAVLKVYGPRYSTTNYWLLSELQRKAYDMKYEINNPAATGDEQKEETAKQRNDDLPF